MTQEQLKKTYEEKVVEINSLWKTGSRSKKLFEQKAKELSDIASQIKRVEKDNQKWYYFLKDDTYKIKNL